MDCHWLDPHLRHRLVRRVALALLVAGAGHGHAQPASAATVEAVGDAVIFKGQLNSRSAAQFLQLLQDPGVRRLVITSGGGSVSAALDMAAAIHERQLDVEVPATCRSSCANYIFPAGRHKTVGRPGAVAWHGNLTHVLYLHQTGQANWTAGQIDAARLLATREAEFFSRIGVDGFVCWFAKIAPYNEEDSYYLSVEDMARFGIRNVTVREAAPVQAGGEPVRQVLVDWAALESSRPAVRLDP